MREIIERFKAAVDKVVEAGKSELRAQGHRATGRLEKSFEVELDAGDLDRLIARIYVEDYGVIMDKGVTAGRIPFSQPGRARVSQYIEGLMRWARVVKPGLGEKERRGFVFAVAQTHKREGMPTRGSYSFSNNGRRKEWIKYGLEEMSEGLERDLKLFELAAEYFEQLQKRA